MSATARTKNYHLPVFKNSDTTDWADYNTAMETLDTQLYAVETIAKEAELPQEIVDQLKKQDQDIKALQLSDTEITTQIQGITNDLTTAKQDIGNLQTDVEGLNDRVGALEDGSAADITKLTEDVASLQTDVANIQQKDREQDTQFTNVAADITKISGDITGLDTRVQALEDGQSGDVSALTDRVNTLETDVTAIKAKDGEQDTQISNIAADITKINGDIDGLDAKVGTYDTDISGLKESVATHTTKITSLESKETEQDSLIEGLAQSATQFQSQIGTLQTKTNSHDSSISTLFNDISELQKKDTDISNEIENLKIIRYYITGIKTLQAVDKVIMFTSTGEETDVKTDFNTGSIELFFQQYTYNNLTYYILLHSLLILGYGSIKQISNVIQIQAWINLTTLAQSADLPINGAYTQVNNPAVCEYQGMDIGYMPPILNGTVIRTYLNNSQYLIYNTETSKKSTINAYRLAFIN